DPAMRAGAGGGIVAIAPVDEIVARSRVRRGGVRYFVGGQSLLRANLCGECIEFRSLFILGQTKGALLVEHRGGSLRLDGELVEGEVICGVAERGAKLRLPFPRRLTGARIDEIEGEAREGFTRERDGAKRLFRRVQTPEKFQLSVVERLHTEREAVD